MQFNNWPAVVRTTHPNGSISWDIPGIPVVFVFDKATDANALARWLWPKPGRMVLNLVEPELLGEPGQMAGWQ
jgi:hypothetical protein